MKHISYELDVPLGSEGTKEEVKASVIIPTKNPGRIFHRVLNAVLKQEAPWEYEVIVIDSGSTDGTLEYCKSLLPQLSLVEILPEEFGHGKTRNYAASLSTGDFILFLTHDALPRDNKWLFNMVAAMEESESIAGAFGRHLPYPDGNPFNARDLKLHFDNFSQSPSVVQIDDWERYQHDTGYKQFLHFFSNNNSCLRKSVFEKIPFPEVDFAEDQIWATRILEAGYSKKYVDDAVVFHSHDYLPVELFKRSVDESRALMKIFGYELCPSIRQIISQAYKTTRRDISYAIQEKLVLSQFRWVLMSFFLNFARQAGFYTGQRVASRDSGAVLDAISLDRSLKAGKRKP